jgi:hypothetical protein
LAANADNMGTLCERNGLLAWGDLVRDCAGAARESALITGQSA